MTELPHGWVEAQLEHLCEILDFKRIPVNSKERQRRIEGKSPQELYPYYGATGQVDVIDGYLFEGEHVLIGEDGAPFLDPLKPKAYMVDGKFWVNNHAHILCSLGNNRFLCHYLNYIRYEDHVTGTTRLKLTKSALVVIPVLVPPLSEQRRIVEKIEARFDAIDKGVESLKTARTALGLYRQSLLKSAFEGRLTADWRARNADKLEAPETLLARIQAERETRYKAALDDWQEALAAWRAGGEKGRKPAKLARPSSAIIAVQAVRKISVPKAWAVEALGNLPTDNLIGLVRSSQQQSFDDGGSRYVKMDRIDMNGGVDTATMVRIQCSDDETQRFSLQPGDLLFNTRNSLELVGKTGIVKRTVDDATVYNNNLMRIRLTDRTVPEYVCYWMISPAFRKVVEPIKRATTSVAAVYAKDLWPLPVPICSPAEQAEIVRLLDARLAAADTLEGEIDAALTRASALRQSILKKAFSGQLVPQDPGDEPAAALLARIRAERAKAPKTAWKRKAPA